MRFQNPLLAVLSLFLLVGFCQASVGHTCVEMKHVLRDKPDLVLKKFETHVCEKGCKFTLHGGKFRKNVVLPAIFQASKEMGIRHHERTLIDVADDITKVARQECGKKLGKKGDICQDRETLAELGKCIKDKIPAVINRRARDLMPLVTEQMCQKEKAYLVKPTLYEEVIPSLLDKYAATCEKA